MRRNIVPALLIALVAACDDPLSPDALRGTYVLERMGDAPLPLEYASGSDGTYTLLADTIGLDGRGEVTRRTVIHRTAGLYGPDTTFSMVRPAEYRVSGGRIEIGSFTPCPPNALCAANDLGHLTGTGFRLAMWVTGNHREGIYRKVSGEVLLRR